MKSSTLLALSLICLLVCKACGQLTVDVVKYQEVTGLSAPTILANKVLVESLDIKTIGVRPVALILVGSSEAEVRVEASDVNRDPVRIEKLDDGTYLYTKSGKVWLEAKEYAEFELNGTKRKFLVDQKTVVVELGKVPPLPDPDDPLPPPPLPNSCDSKTNSNFEYLAKRACQWVGEIPEASRAKKIELAKVYLDASDKLSSGQHLTINAASDAVRKQWGEVLATPELKTAWGTWSIKANEELAKHWVDQSTNTAKREMMVQFFRSLGEGLQP